MKGEKKIMYGRGFKYNIHCLPIAPSDEMILGLSFGMGLVSLCLPISSATFFVLSVMSSNSVGSSGTRVFGGELPDVPRPICSRSGPVDLGIYVVVFFRGLGDRLGCLIWNGGFQDFDQEDGVI